MKLLFHNQRYLVPVASPEASSFVDGKEEGRAGRRPLGEEVQSLKFKVQSLPVGRQV
jgi:hypothetical protein